MRTSFLSSEPGEQLALVLAGDDPATLDAAASALERDLRKISARFEDNPAGYVLGRQKPKEFEPK